MDLKEFRTTQNLSQEKMAHLLGVSSSMYTKVENGHANVSRGFMQKLKAQYPTVNIDEMFFAKEAR